MRRHRQRLKNQGLQRIEVYVPADDAALIKGLAKVLCGDSAKAERLRRVLGADAEEGSASGLKELLASAPLDGIELVRSRDHGRDLDL